MVTGMLLIFLETLMRSTETSFCSIIITWHPLSLNNVLSSLGRNVQASEIECLLQYADGFP